MLIFIRLDLLVIDLTRPMPLLIYTEKNTPRIEYIFQLMIEDIAGFSFQMTSVKDEFERYKGPKMAYANEGFLDTLIVQNSFFLEGTDREVKDLRFVMYHSVSCPFAGEGISDFPFDIFAAGFYLVSRCEEYTSTFKDRHDRFSPYESLAYKKTFLDKPMVNIWALELRKKIIQKFPSLTYQSKKFQLLSTIDVDQLFAIKARGIKRTLGRLGKQLINLDVKNVVETLSVLILNRKDPFDTFDYILSLKKKGNYGLLFFMHLGDYGMYDKSIQWNHKKTKQVVQQLSIAASVGIHPSYRSNEDAQKLKLEMHRYKELLHVFPRKSRQHYLKLSLPETYERLTHEGIKEDYTMGYAECIGFRASICTPFKFYDLKAERMVDLMLYPFAIMDRSLKDGMKLSIEESVAQIKKIQMEVKLAEGIFISIFHNESLSENKEWKGWRSVYESIFQ